MARKNEIIDEFEEKLQPITSKTDMGFQYSLNSQLIWILTVKNHIIPTDGNEEYIQTVHMLKTAIENLGDLLINQIESDAGYCETIGKTKVMERKIIPLNIFVKLVYRTDLERRDAAETGKANIRWNRYRAEKILEIENLKFRGLMKLMQKHNLLLEFDAKGVIDNEWNSNDSDG